jgi:SAM-dependent methyltransferase
MPWGGKMSEAARDGHIDRCTRDMVAGWARKVGTSCAEIEILVNGKRVAVTHADKDRADLGANCGFQHRFDPPLSPSAVVRVRHVGCGADVAKSPYDLAFEHFGSSELEWAGRIDLPAAHQMKRIGSATADSFVRQGTRMARVIERELRVYFGDLQVNLRILDFGCGAGRVLLPLSDRLKAEWHASDVDETAIEYLRGALPNASVRTNGYQPPLEYSDDYFDCVYSISLWTHLPVALQLKWLSEIRRILKPNGLALLTTAGPDVAEIHRKKRKAGWQEVTVDDVRKAGIVYRPYADPKLPGIAGSYGLSVHDPAWIARVWDKVLTVISTRERAIEARQDLHLLTKLH